MPVTYPSGPGAVNELSTAAELSAVSSEAQRTPGQAVLSTPEQRCGQPVQTTPAEHPECHLPTPHTQHRACRDKKAGKALDYQEAAEANQQFEPLTPWQGQSS